MAKFVFEVTREFVSKDHGRIGESGWRVDVDGDAEMLRDGFWCAIPDSSRDALAVFALQTLQDAYAGKKVKAEAFGAFGKKLDAYVNGTIGSRSTSWDSVAKEFVIAALVKGEPGFDKLKPDARKARVKEVMAKNRDSEKFKSKVDAEIAKRKADAERLAKAADDIAL